MSEDKPKDGGGANVVPLAVKRMVKASRNPSRVLSGAAPDRESVLHDPDIDDGDIIDRMNDEFAFVVIGGSAAVAHEQEVVQLREQVATLEYQRRKDAVVLRMAPRPCLFMKREHSGSIMKRPCAAASSTSGRSRPKSMAARGLGSLVSSVVSVVAQAAGLGMYAQLRRRRRRQRRQRCKRRLALLT